MNDHKATGFSDSSMASYHFFNHPNNDQVRSSNSGADIRRRSTTLLCLNRILRTISSFPSFENLKSPSASHRLDLLEPSTNRLRGEDDRRLFDVDLNLSLGSPPPSPLEQEQLENDGRRACDADGVEEVLQIDVPTVSTGALIEEKLSTGGCDVSEPVDLFRNNLAEIEDEIVEEKVEEVDQSQINCNGAYTDTPDEEERKVETEHEVKELRGEGGLDLLIEAVKFISGESDGTDPKLEKPSHNLELSDELRREETPNRKLTRTEEAGTNDYSGRSDCKRRRQNENGMADLYGEFEDVSPVVRSKRGRSQVLPYKYRDSVLEPLKPLSRHRSAAATKRR